MNCQYKVCIKQFHYMRLLPHGFCGTYALKLLCHVVLLYMQLLEFSMCLRLSVYEYWVCVCNGQLAEKNWKLAS